MTAREHLQASRRALRAFEAQVDRVDALGAELGERLLDGARLLACGNGGSAAEAQHLTAELVGRFRDERTPLSALCLCVESSSVTAIGNDYGPDEVFARQVRAHGRSGDVLLCLSTSGTSRNVLAAAEAARDCGIAAWALTGPGPNPLGALCDEVLAIEATSTATVQEMHLLAVHVLCGAVDRVARVRALAAEAVR